MPVIRLLAQLVAYYAGLTPLVALLFWLTPAGGDYLPIGRVQTLIAAAPGTAAKGAAVAH